jgi:hypothetical protein
MNNENEITKQETAAPIAPAFNAAGTNALAQSIDIFEPAVFQQLLQFAEVMSKSGCAVPEYMRDNPGACLSILITAYQHRMNPYGLGGDSYSIENGIPSFGAKSTHAIVEHAAGDSFENEKIGDWSKIEGKVKILTNAKGKPYPTPGWTKFGPEEDGLACKVWLSSRPDRVVTLSLKQCYVRNSTNWASNPYLQLFYQTCKVYARMYFPGAVLGVYSTDEMPDYVPVIDATPTAETVPEPAAPKAPRKSKADKLAEKLGVKSAAAAPVVDAAEVPETPADDLLNAASVNYSPAAEKTVTERIEEAIAATGAPICVEEVDMFLANLGALNGYNRDEIEKYPENIRNRLNAENGYENLVNKAAEWILGKK